MKVELVAKTTGVGKYEDFTSEDIVSAIARHGVIKEDKGRLIRYLMREKHWSPLDMINFNFEVETTRAIGRQWLRHASLKPQEHSQRYSESAYFEDFEIRLEDKNNRQSSTEVVSTISHKNKYVNLEIKGDEHETFAKDVLDHLEKTEILYNRGISLGYAKETVRNILPECATSVLNFNGTLRSWLSFLNVRCDHHSQKEIVQLANLIGEALEKEMPGVFSQIDWRKGMFM